MKMRILARATEFSFCSAAQLRRKRAAFYCASTAEFEQIDWAEGGLLFKRALAGP